MSFLGFILGTVAGGGIGTALQAPLELVNQQLNAALRPTLPTANELINMRYRQLITVEQYEDFMAKLGYNGDHSTRLYNAQRALFSFNDAVNLKRRNLITNEQYQKLAIENGYDAERMALAENATLYFPPVPDLLRFAVREAYSKDIIAKFQTDDDYPEEFDNAAKQAGLSVDDARRYWRAHWELPSVGDGFEMFHRGIITLDELNTLLRTQDYMPFWRDKLIKIAYSPFTRVDVRRMYQLGVLNKDEVFKSYKDLGYDDDKATKLTQFTISNASEVEKDLTVSDITQLYSYREISHDDAQDMLVKMGYDKDEADKKLMLEDFKLAKKDTTDTINFLTDQYTNNKISDIDFRDALGKMNLAAENIDRIIAKAEQDRKSNVKLLEKSDLLSFLDKEVIDLNTFRAGMQALHYQAQDIERFINSRYHDLSKADIISLFKKGIIDRPEALERLVKVGILSKDAELLLTEPPAQEVK